MQPFYGRLARCRGIFCVRPFTCSRLALLLVRQIRAAPLKPKNLYDTSRAQ